MEKIEKKNGKKDKNSDDVTNLTKGTNQFRKIKSQGTAPNLSDQI